MEDRKIFLVLNQLPRRTQQQSHRNKEGLADEFLDRKKRPLHSSYSLLPLVSLSPHAVIQHGASLVSSSSGGEESYRETRHSTKKAGRLVGLDSSVQSSVCWP